ncbi:Immunogenic protein [hydrothermal vent metagenome]|uniref:Immunogenic protein n=1 Tax=hydrothermal vent metagenome TaxID=652676 RepID=A0A1W1CUR8_9ZZZZ
MNALKLSLIFIILLLLPILYILLDRNNHIKSIKIAVSDKSSAYYKDALKYKEELKKEGITLELVCTKGSVESQEKLLKSEVDFAFIKAGTEKEKLLALANVAYEPIWIFYNNQKISDLKSLKGKRIAISIKGSGIRPIARELLNLVGINNFNSKLYFFSNKEALKALESYKIDAMFYISAPNSSILNELMLIPNIHLMDFKEANSYRQFFIQKHKYVHVVKLYSHGFNMRREIPKTTHTLLATTAMLVTYKSSDEIVRLMLKVAQRIHQHMGLFYDENTFPNASMLTLKQHKASKYYFRKKSNYYEENYSFWTAQTLTKIQNIVLKYILPLVTIFGFFIEVIIPAYHLYTRRKLNSWYETINQIDTNIENLNLHDLNGQRLRLQSLLSEIRATDDIPAEHMEIFYTIQNQIVNILDDIDKRIEFLTSR